MATRTRSRLMLFVVLGLITLPAEAFLLPIAQVPTQEESAHVYAAALTPADRAEAGAEIDAYPPVYRRAIMSAMTPAERSVTWRAHLNRFLQERRGLSTDQVTVVEDAVALASTDAFTPPLSPATRDKVSALYTRALATLGPVDTEQLFVTLGPTQLTRPNALPYTQQLADRLRGWSVAKADGTSCNCNVDIDTCDISWDPWLVCSEMYTCDFDMSWPMCGPFWSWACTGWCKVVRWPDPLQ